MTQLTAKDITNLYLYGQQPTSTNLVDDSLIRPEDFVAEVDVDVNEFMEIGAGRFAVGSQFEFVQRFFVLPVQVPPETYKLTLKLCRTGLKIVDGKLVRCYEIYDGLFKSYIKIKNTVELD